VLYGSDALGGVINIVSRAPCDAPRITGSLVTDTAVAGGAAGLRASHSVDALCLAGGATYRTFDDLDGGGALGRQVPGAYQEWSADIAARYTLAPQLAIGITQQFLRQHDVPKTSEVTLGSRAKFDYEPQTRSLTVVGVDGEFWGLDAAHADMSVAWMEEGERAIDCAGAAAPRPCVPSATESVEVTEVLTLGTSSVFAKRFDTHRISIGHEYYGDRYGATKETRDTTTGAVTPGTPGRPDDTRYDSYGLFVQDEWSLSERFELIPGLRYSRFEAAGSGTVGGAPQVLTLSTDALTGSLQGRYALAPAWSLVGGITQGFRAPNIEDFFPQVDFTSFEPNTDLGPEYSLNYELGLKWNLGHASGELIGYWSEYEDLIARANTTPRQNRNLNEATIRGIEFAIETRVGADWLARFNATYTHGDIRPLDPAECGGAASCPARRTPPLFGAATLRYAPAPAWWAEGQLWFADRQDRLNPGDMGDARIGAGGTPGYAVWNLAAAWTPTASTRLQLTAENLTDREWKTHGSGLAAPGRSLRLSWRQAW
jgi:outer membrane receptor protein involved in Fe transport